MTPEWEEFLDQLKRRADLASVADRLGMQLWRRETDRPVTLCPFHDDTSPSLHLYRGQGAKSAYHCFACGAHGDAFDLIVKRKGLSFREAVEWLAEYLGESLPSRLKRPHLSSPRQDLRQKGLEEGLRILGTQTTAERQELVSFARSRGFRVADLRNREIFAAKNQKITQKLLRLQRDHGVEMRELQAELESAGLLVRSDRRFNDPQPHLPTFELRDFFWDERVLFTIRNYRGDLMGFAGRAVTPEARPKYLYSRGLVRTKTLYRLDRVASTIFEPSLIDHKTKHPEDPWVLNLYVVEGFLDVIRLEVLGFQACGALGSSLTLDQAELIADLGADVAQRGGVLAVHLFFDADKAGQGGGARAVLELWKVLLDRELVPLVDVVAFPAESEKGKDPDELLRDKDTPDAETLLTERVIPAAQLMLASTLGCSPLDVDEAWSAASPPVQQWALQKLVARLPRGMWKRVLGRLRPFATAFKQEIRPITGWQESLEKFVGIEAGPEAERDRPPGMRPPKSEPDQQRAFSDAQQLQLAHQLAMASRHRREFPVDDGGWVRIGTAFDAMIPFYKGILGDGKARRLEPYMAVYLPKASGAARLKALPCPEDLTLQQYLLCELLRTYPDHPSLSEYVPAVRWQDGYLWTTGWNAEREPRVREGAVSFAYQVDMDVLAGRVPGGRRAMFRPYFECWKDFIRYLSQGVGQFKGDRLFPLRLDIRGFYDNLRREAVNEALQEPLEMALHHQGFDPLSMAPLLGRAPAGESREERELSSDASKRARLVIDWLCDQSFHYPYLDPESGKPRRSKSATVGVPQGPDLSAYLANVSLFRLDRVVTEAIVGIEERDPLAGVPVQPPLYARYVDDIVLVARQPEELEELRSLIEYELVRIGLSLSRKTDPLPPMTPYELRRWLTDQRGLGSEYGPIPGIDPDLILASRGWGDVGIELDRGTALQLLHSHQPSDLLEKPEEVREAVKLARQAALRPGDEAVAAKLLWLLVASQQSAVGSDDSEPERTIRDLRSLWDQTAMPRLEEISRHSNGTASMDFGTSWTRVAWLEGLLLALRRRDDRSPYANSIEQEQWAHLRVFLARQIQGGLCQKILAEDPAEDEFEVESSRFQGLSLGHQKDLWCCVLWAAAAEVSPLDDLESGPTKALTQYISSLTLTPGLRRQLCTLHTAYSDAGILERLEPLPEAGDPEETGVLELLHLHQAIARLRAGVTNRSGKAISTDPLAPMRASMDRPPSRLPGAEALWEILHLWLPEGSPNEKPLQHAEGIELQAATAFVNVTFHGAADLLQAREWLKAALLDYHGLSGDTRFLPVPPGVSYPGLVAVTSDEVWVFWFRKNKSNELNLEHVREALGRSFLPGDLLWEHCDAGGHRNSQIPWICFRARLGRWVLQQQGEVPLVQRNDDDKVSILAQVEEAFRDLVGESQSPGSWAFPYSADHLMKRKARGAEARSQWSGLGFLVGRNEMGNQAFVRQHRSGGLIAEGVPANGAEVWRVGTALADLFKGLDRDDADPTTDFSAVALHLREDQNPAIETLVRWTLAALRGGQHRSAQISDHGIEGVSLLVDRALGRIHRLREAIESGEEERVLGLALACFLENRLYGPDNWWMPDADRPGSAAHRLARKVQSLLGPDPKLTQALPEVRVPVREFPKRRPSLAWLAVAERLACLPRPRNDEGDLIGLAVTGYRLLGLKESLRAQTLERWAALEPEKRRAARWRLDLSIWGVDPAALLISTEGFRGRGRSEEELAPEGEGEFLLALLERLSFQPTPRDLSELEAVTPLGWLAVLAALSGLLPGNELRPGTPQDPALESARSTLSELSLLLAETWRADEESLLKQFGRLPEVFGPESIVTEGFLSEVFGALSDLDFANNIEVVLEESNQLSTDPRGGVAWEVRSERFGTRSVPMWAIRVLQLRDRKERWEEAPAKEEDGQIRHRATLSMVEGKMIGASWVSREVAALAGIDRQDEAGVPTVEPLEIGKIPSDDDSPNEEAALWSAEVPKRMGMEFRDSREVISGSSRTVMDRSSDSLQALETLQSRHWKARAKSKRVNTARIAFLQWSVDESYRHPIFEICLNHQGKIRLSKDAVKELEERQKFRRQLAGPSFGAGDIPKQLVSCAEHRRRQILKKVLEACDEFGVDVLVLPEYCVRPDTIAWLADPSQISTRTSVWAGTYRLAPGTSPHLGLGSSLRVPRAKWAAILSAVLSPDGEPGGEPRVLVRAKKYPSQALDEVFDPRDDVLKPLFEPSDTVRTPFDPRRYILELICSEIFLATSPTNWRTLASSLATLAKKFNHQEVSEDEAYDRVLEDVRVLGSYLSYQSETEFPRRSLLVVPAMTRRTADYAAFGQVNYLSAGLTTVFCNAVLGKRSIGNSCFIGHDCWDRTDRTAEEGMPSLSPYHGLTPGIYRQHDDCRGWLGKAEQAVVIADVDPLHPVEGKPRPQSLPAPLALVAHLPIIERWHECTGVADEQDLPLCRCTLAENRLAARDAEALEELVAVLREEERREHATTVDDRNPRKLVKALRGLADVAGHGKRDWLRLRAKAYEESYAQDPVSWPPAVSLDWLWVDLGLPGDAANYPRIEVPPYREPPEEEE